MGDELQIHMTSEWRERTVGVLPHCSCTFFLTAAHPIGDVWLHEVAVQAGYTFRYVEELEGESGPTLGWLGWRDREPPLPVRVPAGGVGGRPRDGGARRLSLLTQRRQSALRPAVGMEVSQLSSTYGSSGNGVKLAGPSDSDAKTLEDFMSFVERLDLMEGPEVRSMY